MTWTEERIRALGATTTLPVAAAIFSVSPATAYQQVRADLHDGGSRFPVRATRVGRQYRISVPAILTALGAATAPDLPATGAESAATPDTSGLDAAGGAATEVTSRRSPNGPPT